MERNRQTDRDVVESRTLSGISREKLFERLLEVERFPEWGHGLRRVRLHRPPSERGPLAPGAHIEFGLRAAGIDHEVTSLVTEVEPPRLIEWRYLAGATGSGGWLLEEAGELVRMTLSTDYSIDPPWLDRIAHRPFFRRLISSLLSQSLQRLEGDLKRDL